MNKLYPCEPTTNHLIKFNGTYSKKSSTIFVAKGSIISKIPFDNALDVSIFLWMILYLSILNYVQNVKKNIQKTIQFYLNWLRN